MDQVELPKVTFASLTSDKEGRSSVILAMTTGKCGLIRKSTLIHLTAAAFQRAVQIMSLSDKFLSTATVIV